MKLLHGAALAAAVRTMFAEEDRLRCAVAFWGPELAGIAYARGAHVILDVSMRCTPKASLEALGVGPDAVSVATAERVRVLDGLHAKIYLGRNRCIIGSANASGNALGRNGSPPHLFEASVQVERADNRELFGEVEGLWQSYLDASRAVTLEDRDRAPQIAATSPARDWSGASEISASILEAVLRQPEPFGSTTFVFGDHNIDKDDLLDAEAGYEATHDATPKSHGRSHICSLEGDDVTDRVLRSAANIITYWFGRGEGLYAYHDIVRVEHEDSISYYGRRSWPSISRALGFTFTQDAAWGADLKTARRFSKLEGQGRGERYVALTADAVSELMRRQRVRA